MNEKSIDKMKELLKNARDTSLWWKDNKKSAENYAFVGVSLLYTMLVLTAFSALFGVFWVTSSPMGLIFGLKGLALLSGFGGWIYLLKRLSKKVDRHVAKKFKDGYKLCNFYYMNEIEMDKDKDIVEDVLKAARSNPLSDVQNLCPHLEKMRNVSLPLSWWHQMKSELDSLEIPEDAVLEDKSHDVLEQVYAEMSESTQPKPSAGVNVFKL